MGRFDPNATVVGSSGAAYDGVSAARDGSDTAYGGSGTVDDGSGAVADGAGATYDSSGTVVDGSDAARNGSDTAYGSSGAAYDGVSAARDGSGAAYDGVGTAYDGVGAAHDGSGTVADEPNATVGGDVGASQAAPYAAYSAGPAGPAGPERWATRFWPDWSVVDRIGGGTFGSVFEIRKTEMGYTSKAAAKIILIPNNGMGGSSDGGTEQDYLKLAQRMHDEIRVMSELSGERNIVIIQDSAIRERDDGPGYALGIRMELLESLPTRQRQLGLPFPVEEAVRAAMDVCRALVTCHGRNIMHRDVKPENVFWSNKLGEYKLGDFGISKQLEATAQTWGAQTSIGTPQYEAPEVIKRQKYSYNVDVYSLGVMLFQLLNHGRSPFLPAHPAVFSENDLWSAEGRRIGGEVFPDPACGDEYLADVIRSATAAAPEHRFHSAQAFYNALEAWPGWS